jgi:uncharacterized membrane protein YcfT
MAPETFAYSTNVGSGKSVQRTAWIDAVKGLTITLVVAHHSLSGIGNAGLGNPTLDYWYQLLSPIRMPLFFMVAGLFARRSIEGGLRAFLDAKVLHFLYFYILWSGISHSTRVVMSSYANNKAYMYDLIFIAWDPVLTIWFLYALVLAFVFTRFLRRIDPSFLIAFAASIQAAAFVYPAIPHADILNKLSVLYVYFLIGVYGSAWIRAEAARSNPVRIFLSIAAFCIIASICLVNDIIFQPLFYFVMSCSAIFMIISTASYFDKSAVVRFFAFVGAFSLPIYLTHFLMVAGTRIGLMRIFGTENIAVLVVVAVICGVTFGIVASKIALRTPLAFLFERPSWLKLKPLRSATHDDAVQTAS